MNDLLNSLNSLKGDLIILDKLKTARGQSARIVEDKNGLFSIELYANDKWGKPVSGYDKQFNTEIECKEFFITQRNCIHS